MKAIRGPEGSPVGVHRVRAREEVLHAPQERGFVLCLNALELVRAGTFHEELVDHIEDFTLQLLQIRAVGRQGIDDEARAQLARPLKGADLLGQSRLVYQALLEP